MYIGSYDPIILPLYADGKEEEEMMRSSADVDFLMEHGANEMRPLRLSGALRALQRKDDRPNKRPLAGDLTLNGQVRGRPISLHPQAIHPFVLVGSSQLPPQKGLEPPSIRPKGIQTESCSACCRDLMARVAILTLVG